MQARFRSYHLARFALVAVNLVTVVLVGWLILSTTELICLNDDARNMLERLRAIPARPLDTFGTSTVLYLLLIMSVLIREVYGAGITLPANLALSLVDLIISVTILVTLDFGVKYILLVPIANAVAYLPDKTWKVFFTALAVLCYILFDYQIISVGIPVFSIDDYILYHPALDRASLLGARNVLFSIAEVFFITFLVLELQNVLTESLRIKKLNRELTESRDKLAVANVQLQIYSERAEETAKIKERNRLAREIHDTVGHCLTGISLGLAATRELFRKSPAAIADQLGRLDDLSRQGLIDIRRSLKELRPDMLDRKTLSSALGRLADEINGCSNRRIELRISGNIDGLSPSLEETVYRVVQESITNAVRHGDAAHIALDLDCGDAALRMTIADDGRGCAKVTDGFGLQYMRERVLENNGFMEIESEPGQGFSVSIYIPRAGGLIHD